MPARPTAMLLLAMASVVVGCGGDSGESAEQPQTTATARTRLSERGIAALARLLDRIEGGGGPSEEFTKAAPSIARLTDESNRLARRLGVKDCVVELPSPGAESPQSSS